MIPPKYILSATKFSAALGIFWIIFYGFMTFDSLDFESYPTPALQIAAWTALGLAVGTTTVTMFIKKQLRQLSRDYQYVGNIKDTVLGFAPIILFFIFSFSAVWSIHDPIMRMPVFQGFLISTYTCGISIVITGCALYAAFEKRENMRLMRSWWGPGIVLIPKAPENMNFKKSLGNRIKGLFH